MFAELMIVVCGAYFVLPGAAAAVPVKDTILVFANLVISIIFVTVIFIDILYDEYLVSNMEKLLLKELTLLQKLSDDMWRRQPTSGEASVAADTKVSG
jgi:CBS domain containing-hemolysin-like protein